MAFNAREAAMKRLLLLGLLWTGLTPQVANGATAPDPRLFSYQQHNGSSLPRQSAFHD